MSIYAEHAPFQRHHQPNLCSNGFIHSKAFTDRTQHNSVDDRQNIDWALIFEIVTLSINAFDGMNESTMAWGVRRRTFEHHMSECRHVGARHIAIGSIECQIHGDSRRHIMFQFWVKVSHWWEIGVVVFSKHWATARHSSTPQSRQKTTYEARQRKRKTTT